jgi:type II secretory pathway pseudopilin PulG
MRPLRRRGFSLLEVLLATGILIGSSIVLMQLATIGMQHASSARDRSHAQLICETKLNEIVAGIVPAETVRPVPCEDEPGWTYWVDVRPTERPGLVLLEVGVAQELSPRRLKNRFTLLRWIRDPKLQEPGPSPSSPSQPGVVAQGGLTP